jgi:hypothetical protein
MGNSANFGAANDAREALGLLKRALSFAAGLACTVVGLWLLYRNLVYGDVVSVSIALFSVIMVGTGVVLLAPVRASPRTQR